MSYQLNVGKSYKFLFDPLIENIDDIYKVMTIMSLDDIIESNIDLYKDNFAKINLAQGDYDDYILPNLQDTIIYKLQKMNDIKTIYYIPEFLIKCQPIFNVAPYLRLGLAVNLGIFNDANKLDNVKNLINDLLKTKIGIDKSAIIFSVEEKWLTYEEYNAIEQNRQQYITDTSSIYKDKEDLENTITNLQNIIDTYEEIIINHI